MNTSVRLAPALLLAACAGALALALVAQYGFGLKPCVLCLTQRVPFALAGALSAFAMLPSTPARLARLAMAAAGLALLVNSGIAVYHLGVEQHWWASSCSAGEAAAVSVEDLMAQMSKPVEVACDQPAWAWHGITMAAMNIPFSAALAVFALAATVKRDP